MIFIGSDHAGFALKKFLIAYFEKNKIEYKDLGPFKLQKEDDYPDYCGPVAKAVSQSKDRNAKGIVIGASGLGEAIVANKVKGVRAAVVYDTFTATKSRQHNNANVIALRARGVSNEKNLKLLTRWLATKFSKSTRHKRRIQKIARYEKR